MLEPAKNGQTLLLFPQEEKVLSVGKQTEIRAKTVTQKKCFNYQKQCLIESLGQWQLQMGRARQAVLQSGLAAAAGCCAFECKFSSSECLHRLVWGFAIMCRSAPQNKWFKVSCFGGKMPNTRVPSVVNLHFCCNTPARDLSGGFQESIEQR